MAGSLNHCIFCGHLGRDAELRFTPSGAPVSTFSIACSETWTDKSGQRQEKTEWIRCVLWGKQAESLQEYLVKGKQILVMGRMQTRKWDDKDGVTKYTTEIKVDRVTLLGGGSGSGARRGGHEEGSSAGDVDAPGPDSNGTTPVTPYDDSDIPF